MNSPALVVKNLSVRLGDHIALDEVSFDIPTGAFLAVLGPNGSGKTTLFKSILGLIEPAKGEAGLRREILGRFLVAGPHVMAPGRIQHGLTVGQVSHLVWEGGEFGYLEVEPGYVEPVIEEPLCDMSAQETRCTRHEYLHGGISRLALGRAPYHGELPILQTSNPSARTLGPGSSAA